MSILVKLIIALVLAIALAGGPALYVHIKDDAALKAQAAGYNAVFAQAKADSAAQLKQIQDTQAGLVKDNNTLQSQNAALNSKLVATIHNAPKDLCTDTLAPAVIVNSLRSPP